MQPLPDDRQLYVSARLWHELSDKVDLTPLIYALHDQIDLTRYGDGVRKFYFTFIIVTPADTVNEPYSRYDADTREADVAVAIPYEAAVEASAPEMQRLLETAYLQGVEELRALPLEGAFDVERFKADVTQLFTGDGGQGAGWDAAQ